jgi:ribosome biogenesis protein Tsr3
MKKVNIRLWKNLKNFLQFLERKYSSNLPTLLGGNCLNYYDTPIPYVTVFGRE